MKSRAPEEPTDEEPATEEPTVEEPATEEPTPQAPAEQDPTTAPASGSGRDSGATGQVEQPSDESAITSSTDAVAETTQATGLSDVDVDAADEQATQQVSVTDLTAAPTAATETATDTATQTTATLEQAAAAPVSPVQTAVLALADFVVGVATALLSPFVATGPNGPTGPAASLLELIYVARSRFQDTFFNSSPIVEPMQIAQTGEVVTGTLNAYDADFDRLVYTVTRDPEHGTLVINRDGTFTYTPDAIPRLGSRTPGPSPSTSTMASHTGGRALLRSSRKCCTAAAQRTLGWASIDSDIGISSPDLVAG